MIKYSKIHTDNIRIIQPRTRNKILFIFRTVLRIHKIVRSDLINNLDHPCPPPPYENNFFNIRRIVFVCEVCGKHHLRKFELERIENKFRASRMGKVDGRTDEPRPPRQCFTTNFLSRPVFSHGPPTLRPRKEVINPQEVNPPRGLTVLLSLAAWPAPHCTRLQLPSATFRFLFRHQKWKWAATWSRNLAPSTVKKNLGSLFNWANRFHGWLEKLYSCNSCNCSEYIVYTSLITLLKASSLNF